MERIKNYEEHLERVWEDIVNLLEDEFPLPIQTPAIPSVCPPEDVPSTYTCQTSLKLRTPCKKCGIKRLKLRELLISKWMLSRKYQTVISKQHDNRNLDKL